jgi:hypothetical protein
VRAAIRAISEDLHNLGTSVAKLKSSHLLKKQNPIHPIHRFASTELEYIVTLARGVFDLLQETIAVFWKDRVKLLDRQAEADRASRSLPSTFSKVELREKKSVHSADEIATQFGLPRPFAEEYENAAPFFC